MRKIMKNKQGRKEKKIFKRRMFIQIIWSLITALIIPNTLPYFFRTEYKKKIKEKLMKNSIMNCEKEKN